MKRTSRIKVAKEDIPVWKVMKKYYGTKQVVTCFQGTPIEHLLTERLNLNDIFEGELAGYHCYPERSTALALKKAMAYTKVFVKKMYIPKGAKYVKGVDFQCSEATNGKPVYQASILKLKSNV